MDPEGIRSDKELTCDICLSQYKDPKILPCLHIYCKGCLVGLATKTKPSELTCPKCKDIHKVPPQGIDSFKTYLVISNLVELLQIHKITCGGVTTEIQCESGLDENQAFARCLSCAEYLCISCFHIHQKLTATKHHNVLTLDKIRQSDKTLWIEHLKKRLHICGEHEQEILRLYCKTCREVICRDCALVKHRLHNYVFLREVCLDTQSGIETLLKKIHKIKEEFGNHKRYIEMIHTANKKVVKSSVKEVNESCDQVIQAIEARRAILTANLHRVREAENEQHKERKKYLDRSIVQLSDSIQFTRDLLRRDDDVEIMMLGQQAKVALTRLTKVTFDKEASKPTLLRLTFSDVMNPMIAGFGINIVKSDIVIEDVPTHAQMNQEISFTCKVKVSDDIRHFDATPLLSVRVVCNGEDIPVKILNSGLNHWRVSLSKNPCESGLHTIEVKLGETASVRHTFTVHKLSFYELRKKLQTTYHPPQR